MYIFRQEALHGSVVNSRLVLRQSAVFALSPSLCPLAPYFILFVVSEVWKTFLYFEDVRMIELTPVFLFTELQFHKSAAMSEAKEKFKEVRIPVPWGHVSGEYAASQFVIGSDGFCR